MLRRMNSEIRDCDKKLRLYARLDALWNDHVMWGRSSIISAAAGLDDYSYMQRQIKQNTADFADFFRPYFGDERADKLEELLLQHDIIASNLIEYKLAGNEEAYIAERQKWYANADDIASFLANINAYWNQREWRRLLYAHLDLAETEGIFRYYSEYEKDIHQFDEAQNQAMLMANYMAQGFLRRFPKQF